MVNETKDFKPQYKTEDIDLYGKINLDIYDSILKEFENNSNHILAQNMAIRDNLTDAGLNHKAIWNVDHTFNTVLPIEGKPVMDQRSTGRCWIFAALNCMRLEFMKKFNLSEFSLSASYIYFWHQFESANWFLESIILTINENMDSRLIQHILLNAVDDAGQFDMFSSLVSKYGVVPSKVFPETTVCRSSKRLKHVLSEKLRSFACILREKYKNDGCSLDEIREMKEKQIIEVYRILITCFGSPPKTFSWKVRDKDKKLIEFNQITPQMFSNENFKSSNPIEHISLINDPRNAFYKLYTVQLLGNVVGSTKRVKYINITIEEMKSYVIHSLKEKLKPVWFGCDVGQQSYSKHSILDLNTFDFDLLFGCNEKYKLTKEQRLLYQHSSMTHAMVFTAVDLDKDNKPVKWRVENSWGPNSGSGNGYFMMTDDWFTEHVFQVVIHKDILSGELLDVLESEPIIFPPWDPMGSLACKNCHYQTMD